MFNDFKVSSKQSTTLDFIDADELKIKRTVVVNTNVRAHIGIKHKLASITTYSDIKNSALA